MRNKSLGNKHVGTLGATRKEWLPLRHACVLLGQAEGWVGGRVWLERRHAASKRAPLPRTPAAARPRGRQQHTENS
jgi:hypothetical protein